MKPGALVLGIIVSILLLATAGSLYMAAGNQSAQHYRASIDLIRQIQQLSSGWSIEVARVRSDPLADFDSLAAFIPRMARLKGRLADASRGIPDLPDRLASDIQVYLSLMDTKEERIERFKTGYAVVRNSARYLPLAAANVSRQAEAIGDGTLARSISILLQNMNLYLVTPSDAGKERLGADVEKLREDSVTHPPQIANALANMLAHAEVLLARQAATDVLFHEATSNETAVLADRLSGGFEYEIARQDARAANYEHGVLAVIGVLALFWIALAVHQRARGAAPAAPGVAEAVTQDDAPLLPAPARRHDLADPRPGTAYLESVAAASAPPAGLNAESAMLYRYFSERVGEKVTTAAERIAGRVDTLHRTHRKIRSALQGSEAMVDLPDGTDLDEEVEAGLAVANHMRREINGIANLAKRLASFSNLPNGDAHRDMVDVNACIDEVVAATGAEDAAEVTKRLGDLPEIFASRTEIRLVLAQILENSVRAVEGIEGRKGSIKIDTARRNEEILITIIDNGTGITPERRKQIFRPFYTSRDGAMGLGLTLAGQLVKKYEGGIKINSLLGQGTVIRINLPTGIPAP